MTAVLGAAPRTSRLESRLVVWCALAGLLLLQFWPFERSASIATEVCFLGVLLLGAGAIRLGERVGIVGDPGRWFLFFFAKVVVSALMLGTMWHLPLDRLDMLRVPSQDGLTTDANFYDFVGAYVARTDAPEALKSTWLSLGILSYITGIYKIFGIATLHVNLCNSLLVLVGALGLTGTLREAGRVPARIADGMAWTMFLPYGAYYEMSPAKEPLSDSLLFLGLYAMVTLGQSRGRYALLFACFLLCTLVRANLALVMGFMFLVTIWRTYGGRHVLVSSFALGGLFLAAVSLVISPEILFQALFSSDVTSSRAAAQADLLTATTDSPLKVAVGLALQPRGPFDLIALAPIRVPIWYLLPYPLILPDFKTWSNLEDVVQRDPYVYFRAAEQLCRSLSTIILLFTLPYLAQLLAKWRSATRDPFLLYVGGTFVLLLLLISNFQFINGGRYRVTLEPIGIALALYSGYAFGEPTRLKRVMLVPLFGLSVAISAFVLTR